MKIRTILVPTDFSEHSDKAFETALELAEALKARIVVLHGYHASIPSGEFGLSGGARLGDELYERVRNHTLGLVEEVAKRAAARGVDATSIVSSKPASLGILEQARELPADLIVMGTRGVGGLKHVMFGSTAERIVRNAPCPVLTIKADP